MQILHSLPEGRCGDVPMPLKIELKPYERLIIGNASIRNGDRRCSFILETNTKFLRESDIIREQDADTACKRLYVALEFMYLADNPADFEEAFVAQANDLMAAAPTMKPFIFAIYERISAKEYYPALKTA